MQAAQAHQAAGKARDRQRAESESTRRLQDTFDLRVAGVESAEAVRPAASGRESGQESGRRRTNDRPQESPRTEEPRGIDVRA